MGRSERWRRLTTPRAAAAAVLLAGYLLSLALNLPGQLSYDSIAQLHDGRAGVYNSWHPPVMAWLLGIADAVIPGASLFVILTSTLFFGSALSLLWIVPRPSRLAAIASAICVLLPQLLIYQGTVWKDVLFADAAIAGFVLIAHAGAQWRQIRIRFSLTAGGIALLALAALTRQNGLVVLIFGLAAVCVLAARHNPSARLRALFRYAIFTSVGAAVLFQAANLALATRTPGESGSQAQIKLLENYDLVGAVRETPALKLDRLARANPDLEELIRTDGARLYTPERNDTLVGSAELQDELTDTQGAVLAAQWRDLVLQHPWLYLKIRARVFWWTFATPELARCYPFFVGVQGLSRYMRDLGLTPRTRPQDQALTTYGYFLVGSPIFSHLTYALLCVSGLIVLLRRRGAADVAMALLLTSALAFTASFFVISIACDYRYLIFLDLSALTGAIYLAASCPKTARKTPL